MTDLCFIVLAAGDGTRMKSDLPKVLHKVAGRSIINHVVAAARDANATEIAVVVAPEREIVKQSILKETPDVLIYEQAERLGTAHGAKMAKPSWVNAQGYITVVYGDHPLLRGENFTPVFDKLDEGNDVAILAFEPKDPTGYGRLIANGEQLTAIREHKDASEAERKIGLCNACALTFKADVFRELIDQVKNDNAQGEYYLPDLVELAHNAGYKVTYATAPEEDVMGVNSRRQLALSEKLFQIRLRNQAMDNGTTLIDPDTVFFAHDTVLGRDVTIEPNVFFDVGVSVADGATIHAFSHLAGARVGPNASVGPYARLRPDAVLEAGAKVGNFCEVKKAHIGEGAKINHLTYIGDAEIGPRTNVGAGTITCNYDGINKSKTIIGADAFIGSNSSLIAPVTIGDGAYVGSGTVVSKDIERDALALARTPQENKLGYAPRLKARAQAIKDKTKAAAKENK